LDPRDRHPVGPEHVSSISKSPWLIGSKGLSDRLSGLALDEVEVRGVWLGAVVDGVVAFKPTALWNALTEEVRKIWLGGNQIVGICDVDPAAYLPGVGRRLGTESFVDDSAQAQRAAQCDEEGQSPAEPVGGFERDYRP
jgi:hypothetical protein